LVKFIDASDPAFRAAASVGAFKGAVENLGNSEYHALKNYWSSSDLKFMYKTNPEIFHYHYFGRGKDEPIKQTPEQILGSLVHTMLLMPNDYEKEFFYMPDLNLRTNDGKAEKERLLTENAGKTPVTAELLATAQNMKSAAERNPQIVKLLGHGRKECAFFWTCPFSGLNFKAKLDQASSQWWSELKTTRDASPDFFSKAIHEKNYDLSLYHYHEAIRRVMDVESPANFICIASDEPHTTQVYKASASCFETGHQKWLDSVMKLETALKTGIWPGYFPQGDDIPEISPPTWAVNKIIPKGLEC
jgi:exodeoxyribonuclease VIII